MNFFDKSLGPKKGVNPILHSCNNPSLEICQSVMFHILSVTKYFLREYELCKFPRRAKIDYGTPEMCFKHTILRWFMTKSRVIKQNVEKKLYILDGFIFVYQFSWIERKWHICGFQNSWPYFFPSYFIQKITNSWLLEFVDRILQENHENWYPTKIKPPKVLAIID